MIHQLPPAGQQILRAFIKSWVKSTTVLPVVMPLGLALFLALLYDLANIPAPAAADLILNSLGESYLSLALPAAHFWTIAYLLAALCFVTGWESARPASWLLPTLYLQSWTTRLERILRLRHLPLSAAPVNAPSLNRRRCFPPGPTGLQPPATLTGAMPLLE